MREQGGYTMSTTSNRLERRGAQRFEVHQPLMVHFDGQTVPGFTQDLSGRGIFFYVEAALAAGSAVELTFTMPAQITLGDNMPVRCRGRVLRASSFQDRGRSGIAVQLSSYEYLPADEPLTHFVRVSAVPADAAASNSASR